MAPESEGALVECNGRCDDVSEGPGARGHAVVGGRNHLDRRATAIEQNAEHPIQRAVLGKLRHHQTGQFIADDEIVGARCQSQGGVSLFEEFCDDADPFGTVRLHQLAERHQRQQCCGICLFGRQPGSSTQHDDLVECPGRRSLGDLLGTSGHGADLDRDRLRRTRTRDLDRIVDLRIDDDLDGRLRTEELVEFGHHPRAELAPPDEDDSPIDDWPVGNASSGLGLLGSDGWPHDERAVVGGDPDQFVAGCQDPVGRRVEDHVSFRREQTHETAGLEHQMSVAELGADEFGERLEVDLVAVEVEELTKDSAQPPLSARLRCEFSDHGVGVHDHDLLTEQRPHGSRCVLADEFGNDRHARFGAEMAHREQRLHDRRIVAPDHHHASCRCDVDEREIGERRRVPAATHDLRGAEVADRVSQRLFHHHFVLVGEHHDCCTLHALVRQDQLAHDGGHPIGPTEDEGVAVLEDGAAALAERLDALIDRAGDESDEAAGDEDAGQRDRQPQDPGPPTAVTGERPGVDDSQHRLPERLTERQAVATVHPSKSSDHQDDR